MLIPNATKAPPAPPPVPTPDPVKPMPIFVPAATKDLPVSQTVPLPDPPDQRPSATTPSVPAPPVPSADAELDEEELIIEELLRQMRIENELAFDQDENPDEIGHEEVQADAPVDVKNKPIYPGHDMTLNNSALLTWFYIMHYNLTGQQTKGLLHLLNLHFIEKNTAYNSVHSFKKVFNELHQPAQKVHFCPTCKVLLQADSAQCPNAACLSDVSKSKDYFLQFDVDSQLTNLLNNNKLRDKFNYPQTRKKKVEGNIEDVYDGEAYKKLRTKFQQGALNITLTGNTDGVSQCCNAFLSMLSNVICS